MALVGSRNPLTPRRRHRRTDAPAQTASTTPCGTGFYTINVDTRQFSLDMQVWQWSNGELVAHETHSLVINSYTSSEIVAALHASRFR